MSLGPDHYRYVDEVSEKGVTIVCQRWVVCGETDACWYVLPEGRQYLMPGATKGHLYEQAFKKARKRILKYEGGRKFCYKTRDEALRSYTIRKRWQLRHTEHAYQRAKTALAELENRLKGKPAPERLHVCEGGEYFKEMNWEGW